MGVSPLPGWGKGEEATGDPMSPEPKSGPGLTAGVRREPRHRCSGAEHFAAVCSWAEASGVFGSGGVEGSEATYWRQTDSS